MSGAGLHLATTADAALCYGLAEKYHVEIGAPYDAAHREAVMAPLLAGGPMGAVWMIGPTRAPLGYVLVTFDWSIEAGGQVGWVREIFIRDKVRGRGIGTESLHAVARALRAGGVKMLHVDLPDSAPSTRIWARAGFAHPTQRQFLTDVL